MTIPVFVQQLREMVGSDHLLWLAGVNAVVVDGDGRVLLHRRSDNGAWCVISGILDPGEQPADGVVREVWEETGVRVRVERLTSVTVSPRRCHTNGDHVQYLELTFLCSPVSGHAHVHDDESIDVGWFTLAESPGISARTRGKVLQALSGEPEAWFQPSTEQALLSDA